MTEKAVMTQRERTTAHQSQFRLLVKSDRLLPVPAARSTPMCLENHNESRVLCTRGYWGRDKRREQEEEAGESWNIRLITQLPIQTLPLSRHPLNGVSTDVPAGLQILAASWWPSEHSPHSTFCPAAPLPPGSLPFLKIASPLFLWVSPSPSQDVAQARSALPTG